METELTTEWVKTEIKLQNIEEKVQGEVPNEQN